MIQGKTQGVLSHLLKDPGWDKEQSAPDSGHKPWVCFTCWAELGEEIQTHTRVAFRGRSRLLSKELFISASALMRSTSGAPPGPGVQVAGLQEGLVCCLPGREGLPGSPFQVVRIYTQNTVLSFPLFPSQSSKRTPCIHFHLHAFSWSLTLHTLYIRLSIVFHLLHMLSLHTFSFSFTFHLFPRKIVHFPCSQWQLFMQGPPCALHHVKFFMWSHLNCMTSRWGIILPSLQMRKLELTKDQ